MSSFAQKLPTFVFLLVAGLPCNGQGHFTWTPGLKQAYHDVISLRFDRAETELAALRKTDPGNLLLLHVENYLDFFKVYIAEDEAEFQRLEKNKDRRLRRIVKEGDKNSPYFLFLQADIRLQWALARLKFEQYATAFFETNKAFKLLTENDKKFPLFMPAKKDLGILHAMVGTIPGNYKWAVEFFSSMDGSIGQGRGELEEAIEYAGSHDFIYETEIYVYYTYLLLHLDNDSDAAWRVIHTANLDPSDNPMACFILANLAMRTDRGEEAISILEQQPAGPEFYPFHYLDYMLGVAKLEHLDEDANLPLERFVKNFKGKNFIKDAYRKLAWHQLLGGGLKGYEREMEHCKDLGAEVVESDRSAARAAALDEVPVVELLKARLLFDGGHFQRAFDLLKTKQATDYIAVQNQLEFTYRMGRITHKLQRYDEALSFYQSTIDRGAREPWYFACRAALERGHIFEEQGRKAAAIAAYKRCLGIDPEEYKSGLHQQAKAGLRRLD